MYILYEWIIQKKNWIKQNERTFSWYYWAQYILYNDYWVHASSITVNFIFDNSSLSRNLGIFHLKRIDKIVSLCVTIYKYNVIYNYNFYRRFNFFFIL